MNFQVEQDEKESKSGADELADAVSESDPTFAAAAEKKPQVSAGTLGLFTLMLMAGGLVYFMYLRTGPQSANAADAGTAETISQFLTNGEEHVALMKQTLQNTDKVVQRFRAKPAQTQVPLAALRTNPFRQLAPVGKAEVRSNLEQAEVLESVKSLQLQSIMYGESYQGCMINNALYRPGQQVDRFVVERISSDAVIVRSGTYRFELRMAR